MATETTASQQLTQLRAIVARLGSHPLLPADARLALSHVIAILGRHEHELEYMRRDLASLAPAKVDPPLPGVH